MARSVNYTSLDIVTRRLTEKTLINICKKYDSQGQPVTPQAIDTAKIESEIIAMSDFIDAKIGSFYTVPLPAPVNAEIAEICYHIVVCQLYLPPAKMPEAVENNCKAAKEMLDEIAEGSRDITGLPRINGIAEHIDAYPTLNPFTPEVLDA